MNDQDAAFVERMTAEATHEIMNGLASIGQASGLMGDLLELGLAGGGIRGLFKRGGGQDTKARFKKSITSVQNSMQKSLETTSALNRFIHDLTPGEEPARAKPLVESMGVLMRRSAKQRKVELKVEDMDPEIRVVAPAFVLYRGLAACIDALLAQAEPGIVLSLGCQAKGPGVEFCVQTASAFAFGDLPEALRQVGEELLRHGCTLHEIEDGYGITTPLADG
jgi:signal transduction histidine kinase